MSKDIKGVIKNLQDVKLNVEIELKQILNEFKNLELHIQNIDLKR